MTEKRVAIVTGASRGIGAAIAKRLAKDGLHVIAIARTIDKLNEVVSQIKSEGGSAEAIAVDISDFKAFADAIEKTTDAHGRLDVLVNNAGVWDGGTLDDLTPEAYRRVIEINQVGVFLGMRAVAPHMRGRGCGSIVNISSNAGLRVNLPNLAGGKALAYVASKWAVRGMTRSAALELAPFGVRVNAVYPGPVDTAMIGGGHEAIAAGLPLRRLAAPEEIARVALFLASDESSYVNGAEIAVDGAATA